MASRDDGQARRPAPLRAWMVKTLVCHCGRVKDAERSFCDGCWDKLPAKIKAELRVDFDRGFEHAVQALGWE